MIFYCKKCGRTIMTHSTKEEEHTCDYCRSKMYKLPTDMYESDLDIVGKDAPLKQRIYEELVKPSPEFDQKLFDSRDGDLARRNAEINRQMKMASAFSKGADMKMILKNDGENLPTCPTCGSLNVKKISGAERIASVGFWGLLSGKINKSFKCNNCGYTW